jgi:hypothetical protein
MIPDANGKPESHSPDAEQMEKLLEIELIQKKMEWAATADRYRKLRTASFLFLALVIMGALAAFFLFFSHFPLDRSSRPAPAASASP